MNQEPKLNFRNTEARKKDYLSHYIPAKHSKGHSLYAAVTPKHFNRDQQRVLR